MLWPVAVTKQWPVGSLSPVAGPRVTLVTLVPPRDTWHRTGQEVETLLLIWLIELSGLWDICLDTAAPDDSGMFCEQWPASAGERFN